MRLIDGDALQQEFEDLAAIQWNKDTCTTCARAFKESAERVEDSKTVDAIPVVRCKNCKYLNAHEKNGKYVHCSMLVRWVENDFFCAFGKRNDPHV